MQLPVGNSENNSCQSCFFGFHNTLNLKGKQWYYSSYNFSKGLVR